MNLTDNKNSYYFGTDAARQGAGQAGTTRGHQFLHEPRHLGGVFQHAARGGYER